jgi:hypothetical protein
MWDEPSVRAQSNGSGFGASLAWKAWDACYKLLAMKRRSLLNITIIAATLALLRLVVPDLAPAQKQEIVWSAEEKPLAEEIRGLRELADDVRARTTKDLALKIRRLPANDNKLRLATNLAGRSTEGDFGRDTLQEVATTLAETLRERPVPWPEPKPSAAGSPATGQNAATREPASPYIELATLVR